MPQAAACEIRLTNAQRRVAAETPFSPAWAAAMAELEEAERQIAAHRARYTDSPSLAGRRAVRF
ncbi:MAG TPA: hypothetical protein VFR93_08825 [Candidatus Limnocylindrales bacterium]|nr:hypothetical protein [Candidatus Limnocylindrales bacterium]